MRQAESAPAPGTASCAARRRHRAPVARLGAGGAPARGADSPPARSLNASLPKITQFWTELGQNQRLFDKYRELKASPEYAGLAPARRKLVENALRDFRLGGAELPAEVKPRYAAIQEELATLSAKFSENVLDATNAYSIVIEDEKRLAGIPADDLQAAREAAEKDGRKGWKFNLQMPSYFPVMQYAEDRALREAMYRESATRASEFGKADCDNTPLIRRILALRKEDAALLGYANSPRSRGRKRADAEEVVDFCAILPAAAAPRERDLHIARIRRRGLGLEILESWDFAFASESCAAKRYAFSDQEVKQYLPETRFAGLFECAEDSQLRSASEVRPASDGAFSNLWQRAASCSAASRVPVRRATKRGGAGLTRV